MASVKAVERLELLGVDAKSRTRFWSRVQKTDKCWIWIGGTRRGYGTFTYRQVHYIAHRFAYWLWYGTLPDLLMHTCDNPVCVRPDHMCPGTQQQNLADMRTKGRHYHKLTVEETNELVRRYQTEPNLSQRDLAREYGVSQAHVWRLIHGS